MARVPGKIQKLEETVINRIAAGEVIQRPANALKELMENSLDAGAENVQVQVNAGGMKLLQIQDDGSGIREEDLAIVCERFTTSKLSKFEDLQTISTYGFRGEALASISHVARLSIITKTEDSQCAFRAEYLDGKLKEYPEGSGNQNPKRCAGKQGTTICVEDLFYNMETRRKALKNASEEHNRIADVVTRYAVHNYTVGFSLKKSGEPLMEIRTPPQSSVLDNVRILYGPSIARELIEVHCEDKTTKLQMRGYVSNVNYSTKKAVFILFINNRLVESSALRKTMDMIYSKYLPKGMHSFVYLALDLDPHNVDVNVHPTKHEVHFLHEDMIISQVTGAVENVLLGANESRTYLIQSLLPGAAPINLTALTAAGSNRKRKDVDDLDFMNKTGRSSTDPRHMVRTDPKIQKLDRFLSSTPNRDQSNMYSFCDSPSKVAGDGDNFVFESLNQGADTSAANPAEKEQELSQKDNSDSNTPSSSTSSASLPKRREIKLKSVKNIREKISKECHNGLLEMIKKHTFVGCVDRMLALYQHETALFISNVSKLSCEFFYQKLVFDFGNYSKIVIEDPVEVQELASLAIDLDPSWMEEETEDKDAVVARVTSVLMSKRRMLADYFSLVFDDEGRVTALPLLIHNYFPNMEGLPGYIMSLAKKVNWTNEQQCFETFCCVTAQFYAIPPGDDKANDEITLNGRTWKWTIEHLIFPELRKNFLPPKLFAEDSTVLQLTTLPELYRVFERC